MPVLFVSLLILSCYGLARFLKTDFASVAVTHIQIHITSGYHMGGTLFLSLLEWFLFLLRNTSPSVWILVLGLSLVTFCLLVVPGFAAGVPLRPPKRRKRRSTRSRSSGLRYRKFRRRHLHYCLVQRCYRRVPFRPLLGPRIRQHRRWRRRRDHKRPIYRVKRRQFRMNAFLQPLPNSYALWNNKRVVYAEFIDTAKTTFLPHANHGYVSEEALN